LTPQQFLTSASAHANTFYLCVTFVHCKRCSNILGTKSSLSGPAFKSWLGEISSLFPYIQTSPGAYPTSYSMATGVLSHSWRGRGVMLNTHLHLVLRFTNMWSRTSTSFTRLHGVDTYNFIFFYFWILSYRHLNFRRNRDRWNNCVFFGAVS
jgi:hypothetical protein